MPEQLPSYSSGNPVLNTVPHFHCETAPANLHRECPVPAALLPADPHCAPGPQSKNHSMAYVLRTMYFYWAELPEENHFLLPPHTARPVKDYGQGCKSGGPSFCRFPDSHPAWMYNTAIRLSHTLRCPHWKPGKGRSESQHLHKPVHFGMQNAH